MADNKNVGSGSGSSQGSSRDFDENSRNRNSSTGNMGSSRESSGRINRESDRDRGSREDDDIAGSE